MMEEKDIAPPKPDYLQHTLPARTNGKPPSPAQKRAHTTLPSQTGTNTIGTAMGSILRFLLKDPAHAWPRSWREIDAARTTGTLSSPVQYVETRELISPVFSLLASKKE